MLRLHRKGQPKSLSIREIFGELFSFEKPLSDFTVFHDLNGPLSVEPFNANVVRWRLLGV